MRVQLLLTGILIHINKELARVCKGKRHLDTQLACSTLSVKQERFPDKNIKKKAYPLKKHQGNL